MYSIIQKIYEKNNKILKEGLKNVLNGADVSTLTGAIKDFTDILGKELFSEIVTQIENLVFDDEKRKNQYESVRYAEKIKMLRAELEKTEEKTLTADMFIATVRKYTRIKKLTREILHELIDEIKINHAEKLDSGETVQIITIYWNCIGAIEIPDLPKIPDVDVTVNTRKGVNVKYAPKLSA